MAASLVARSFNGGEGPANGYHHAVVLNERLWKFLRKEALQKWHATFEDMQQAVADVLDNLDRYKSEMDSLMTEETPV